MGNFFSGLFGIAFAVVLIKYRESVANLIGEASWMQKVGGVYNFVILVAVGIFLFSLAAITGTTEIFFAPVLWLLPGGNTPKTPTF